MAYTPIQKNIEPSLNRILELMIPSSYKVKLSGHHLNDRIFEITKGDRQFDFQSTSKIIKGLQNHKEIQFENKVVVELEKNGHSIFIHGKHILSRHISYDDENMLKIFSGNISSFSTCENLTELDLKHHRFIIPCGEKEAFSTHGFQKKYFVTPNNKSPFYISLNIANEDYHLFNYKLGAEYFLIIDSIQNSTLDQFQKKCFNALLALGFTNGNLIHDECFILSYSNKKMEIPDDILYHAMRTSVKTNQPVFTANPFSVYHDVDFEMDEKGIKKEILDKLNEDMNNFSDKVFSKLSTLFFQYEKLQRAALIFIQSHTASLEIKIPNYYVAIEAVTGHIISEIATEQKTLNPIKNSVIAKKLIEELSNTVERIKKENQLNDNDFDLSIVLKNINKINAPPNADKLAESFNSSFINYILSDEQKNILKDRNRFLHGSFLKTVGDDAQFREALHTALRLQFLIAVLVLKLADFTGKIINYAELWSHVTEKKLGEERLIKI